ncbi:XPA protein [Trinorchestia longiramus]|nr:XPA protein [Trinorchestia longiramus]
MFDDSESSGDESPSKIPTVEREKKTGSLVVNSKSGHRTVPSKKQVKVQKNNSNIKKGQGEQTGSLGKSGASTLASDLNSGTDGVSCDARIELTAAQRARIEQNRQKALLIRRNKLNKVMPPRKKSEMLESEGKKVLRINDTKLIDTGGGFFIEEEDDFSNVSEAEVIAALRKAEEPAPLLLEDRPRCGDCGNSFDSSYLLKFFDHPTCDDCRDSETRHALVTKTDARTEYLLTDVDLDKREPPLRFIVRKNPHNERWGEMKLYLKLQIEKRCLEVWGSEEALEEAMAKKAAQRELAKQKKFKKKMQELRMNVRSSLYTRASKSHEHEYGPEEYIEEDDEYSKTCATCGHSYRYDKM